MWRNLDCTLDWSYVGLVRDCGLQSIFYLNNYQLDIPYLVINQLRMYLGIWGHIKYDLTLLKDYDDWISTCNCWDYELVVMTLDWSGTYDIYIEWWSVIEYDFIS